MSQMEQVAKSETDKVNLAALPLISIETPVTYDPSAKYVEPVVQQ